MEGVLLKLLRILKFVKENKTGTKLQTLIDQLIINILNKKPIKISLMLPQ